MASFIILLDVSIGMDGGDSALSRIGRVGGFIRRSALENVSKMSNVKRNTIESSKF